MVEDPPTVPLLTDPLLLEYRNRSGLARVEAGQLEALPPRYASGGPHLSLIREAFASGILPVVDVPDEGGLQVLLDLGLEERLGTLTDLDLGLDVCFHESWLLMWAGAPKNQPVHSIRQEPLLISVQPLVDAFGMKLANELAREIGRALNHHVGVWSVLDAQQFSEEAFELYMDDEEADEQLAEETRSYLRTRKLTKEQITDAGPLRDAYLDWVAEEYPRSATGHTHLFRNSLYREDWPDLSELSPVAQRVYARFEERLDSLHVRFQDGYREGRYEEDTREDDEEMGPPAEAIVLTLDGAEGEFVVEAWHDRAEMYYNQRAMVVPPLLLALDSENEPLGHRLHRLEQFLTSFEHLDLSVKELREWIGEIGEWHAQAELIREAQGGSGQAALFPKELEKFSWASGESEGNEAPAADPASSEHPIPGNLPFVQGRREYANPRAG